MKDFYASRSIKKETNRFLEVPITQSVWTKHFITTPKFIAGLSRNPIFTTKIRHSLPSYQTTDKTHALTHDIALFPGHKNLLYAPVSCVTDVPCIVCYLCTLIGPKKLKSEKSRLDPVRMAVFFVAAKLIHPEEFSALMAIVRRKSLQK